MATTPVYGWAIPDLGSAADGPDAFSDLALGIEGTLTNTTVASYTPAWTSAGTQQPASPATRVGRYRVQNGICDLHIRLTFGASTSGGRGDLRFSLPVPARSDMAEQFLFSSMYHPVWFEFGGYAKIFGSNPSIVTPHFPFTPNDVRMIAWKSANETANVGTGTPQLSGAYTVANGGSVVVHGRYFCA